MATSLPEQPASAPPNVGDLAPGFTLSGTERDVALSSGGDGPIVLVFYREERTPACRTQLAAFAEAHPVIAEAGASLLALSTDSEEAQRAFAAELAAPFPLLSDPDGRIASAYGVYDPTERRAHRAVFVISPDQRVLLALPWFNPNNSAQLLEVLAAVGVEA